MKKKHHITTVIILAAGKGTRFSPLTNTTPKAMIRVNNKPLILYLLESLPSFVKKVFIVYGHLGVKLKKQLGEKYNDTKIIYKKQSTKETGTLGALLALKKENDLKQKFAVFNCDDLYNANEIEKFLSQKNNSMGISRSIMPENYHRVCIKNKSKFDGFIRNKKPNPKKNKRGVFVTGAYILDEKIFELKPVKINGGELGIPQTLELHKDDYPIFIFKFKYWLPINSPKDINRLRNS